MRRIVAAAALQLLVGAIPVAAHNAPSGWAYDPECCGGDTTGLTQRGDCAPVPDEAIREVPGGYRVTVAPGTHPSVPARRVTLDFFVPHGDPRIRVSGDGKRHACISKTAGILYCIYVPPGGV